MMKIDFEAKLLDMDGKPMKERQAGPDGKVVEIEATLGRVAANALLAMGDEDKGLTGEQKAKRYELAMKVIKGSQSLKVEEITEIKATIGRHYAPIVVGQAWKMLDPGE